jgi:purine-binding chemotaxis protein CheW
VPIDSELLGEIQALHRRLRELESRVGQASLPSEPLPDEFDVLFVRIGGVAAAFELRSVREVVPAAALTPVPEAPAWVLGLLNIRGATVPVVDIGSRLEGRPARLRVNDLIVVASGKLGAVGLVVNEVDTVARIQRSALQPAVHETPHAEYVLGAFPRGERSVVLLGLSELLRQADLPLLTQEAPA